jgi:hypothetical protein
MVAMLYIRSLRLDRVTRHSYKAGPVGAPDAWRRAGVKSTDR